MIKSIPHMLTMDLQNEDKDRPVFFWLICEFKHKFDLMCANMSTT